MHSTHFIYSYRHMLKNHSDSDRGNHMGYSFRLAARILLYAPSHTQDCTNHGLCYTSRGALVGTRNSLMGPPWRIDPTTHRTIFFYMHRQDSTYHSLCYTSRGALAGTRKPLFASNNTDQNNNNNNKKKNKKRRITKEINID